MPFKEDIQALPFQLQSATKIRKVASLRRSGISIVGLGFSGVVASDEYGGRNKVTQSKNGFSLNGNKTVLALCMMLGLQGCGMSQMVSGFGSGMFGSETSSADDVKNITEEHLLSAAKSDSGGSVGGMLVAHGCPKFVIWPRDRLMTIYDHENGSTGDAFAVKHRGEITKTARECKIEDGRVTVKYGFAGQVLLGPKGKPGLVSLPVKIYVTDGQREKINSEIVNVSVNIAPENRIGYFSLVRSITIPVPQGARAGDYKLFVAFDRIQKPG